jgi:hypothetical protein
MARKFLYVIAGLIVLTLAVLFALRIWADELTELALVPTAEFEQQSALAANAYQNKGMWFARPDLRLRNDPVRWQPPEASPEAEAAAGASEQEPPASAATPAGDTEMAEAAPDFAVFFVHPTSFLNRSRWNAPLDDAESQNRARIFLRGLASPFGQASEIWAPRYRQATFGAFLTDAPEASQAIEAAYEDIDQAFTYFLDNVEPGRPIVLAGHSQGALHVIRLVRERIAGTPLEDRIAAVYAVGWPISIAHDVPALGLPACATPDQGGCIASWSSFAEPADPGRVLETYRESLGYDGQMRGDTPILCLNPLTGMLGGEAPASVNLGTLVPNAELTDGVLLPGAVPARCDERGLLLIGDPPELGPYVLPGNNYHVYDIPLFWRNVQVDVARRVRGWAAR